MSVRNSSHAIPTKNKKRVTLAEQADKHLYYERAVQDTEIEFEFVDATFRQLIGRTALTLREDFCGTAKMCWEWVQHGSKKSAIGVDLDGDVLVWGMKHHISRLTAAQQRRVTLCQANVLTVKVAPVDLIVAMNFSYQIFKERALLRRYFRSVRRGLVEDGLFILDAFGGYDALRELEERTDHGDFTYIWDQSRYNPITGEILCHIHFTFPDRSKMRNAFTYDWRLWSLPELQELLLEAGFKKVTVYWQGTDAATGQGNGIFSPATVGDADPGWISFIAAEK
ncbi:MAG: hypothetical protein FD130_1232 [Halothiobacillaceae bacterium]|nr:MAG: hypothetical protein FD130_1232 [Halothiobacillaceae bacterium]